MANTFHGPVAMVVMGLVAMLLLQGGAHANSVSIVNKLGEGMLLMVRCRGGSNNKDFGYQNIWAGRTYGFSFIPSYSGREVYQCNFYARGYHAKSMRVYEGIAPVDNFCRCYNCHWVVSPSGFDCENGQYHEKWQ